MRCDYVIKKNAAPELYYNTETFFRCPNIIVNTKKMSSDILYDINDKITKEFITKKMDKNKKKDDSVDHNFEDDNDNNHYNNPLYSNRTNQNEKGIYVKKKMQQYQFRIY